MDKTMDKAIDKTEAEEIKKLLKQEGLKCTKHRCMIMQIIADSSQPLTAEQIFLELRDKDVSINLSTVYRTLESFVSKGLIIKTNVASDTKSLFELNRMVHKHYLICVGCKKMLPVDGCPLEEYEKLIHDKVGFDITGHRLEIYGYCRDCKKDEVHGS